GQEELKTKRLTRRAVLVGRFFVCRPKGGGYWREFWTYNFPAMGSRSSAVSLRSGKGRAEARNEHLGVHCVNVYVRDQDRSLKFYVEQLGFRIAYDAKLQSGERWVAVSPPDGSAVLALIKPRPKSQEAKLIGRATQVVFLTDDVAAKF